MRLRYVSDPLLTITRERRSGHFGYRRGSQRIRKTSILKRIQSLAIPPAWKDVRICVQANGHLQAVGRDARGRKQYVYHPRWRELRDRRKFEHMVAFARALPRIRRKVKQDLRQREITKLKVLAAVVRLLDTIHIRVGNEEYARDNDSFGLTTLRVRHARVRGKTLQLSYRGKSGKNHCVKLKDAQLARIVARCLAIPGQELFQYLDDHHRRHTISSADVNLYLRDAGNADVTAKDFRTWAGTVRMAAALDTLGPGKSTADARRKVNKALLDVASHLGNTPAICRKSYIHPAILDGYLSQKGLLGKQLLESAKPIKSIRGLRSDEVSVLQKIQSSSP